MKYKGFDIVSVPLFDYRPDKKSLSGQWKAVKVGVEYYSIQDPMDDDKQYCGCATISECKEEINRLLGILGMKDNSQKSWDKLDNTKRRIKK